MFQTECTISLKEKDGENYVLAATLDMWNDLRMKKNMSDAMKYSEKVKEDLKVDKTLPTCYRWNAMKLFSALLTRSTAVMLT